MKNRLFMTADDLTGALDSGVQFAKHNLSPLVVQLPWDGNVPDNCDAVIVCTDSRHIPARNAREIVKNLFRTARETGKFTCFFKKLDSTLRGNVGAEIAGLLEGLGAENVQLLNAFPAAGRTTKNGCQFVNGVPLAETSFAKDPFNPISISDIAGIISSQADIADKVVIHDAETDADIDRIAAGLASSGKLTAVSGCAGLADGIARMWHREKTEKTVLTGNPVILVGSLNPAADAQLAHAEKMGYTVRELPACFIDGDSPEKAAELFEISRSETLIIRTPRPDGPVSNEDGANMASAMGRLFRALIAAGHTAPTLVIGGDTLSACIKGTSLQPLGEPIPGTVIFRAAGTDRLLLSRAGGFGAEDAITKIIQLMKEGIPV